jgi:hypothetical protein
MYAVMLSVHVAAGLVGLLLGPIVLWRERRPDGPPGGLRRSLRIAYLAAVGAVSVSAVVLVAGWRTDLWWLAPVAVLCAALAGVGTLAATRAVPYRAAVLAHGLGGSYIALVTAFVVVALTVDGPVRGPAALLPWLLPTLLGTGLAEHWRLRIERDGARTTRRRVAR